MVASAFSTQTKTMLSEYCIRWERPVESTGYFRDPSVQTGHADVFWQYV